MKPATVALVLCLAFLVVTAARKRPNKKRVCGKDYAITLGRTCMKHKFQKDKKAFEKHLDERLYDLDASVKSRMSIEEKLIKFYTPLKSSDCPAWSRNEKKCCRGRCKKKQLMAVCRACYSPRFYEYMMKNKR